MKMKAHLASLVVLFASSAPLLSATEVERLRALCAEQELQIAQLELKISRLNDTPPSHRTKQSSLTASTGSTTEPRSYTIVAGDNLVKISRKLGVSMESLEQANGITRNTIIHPGQKLKVSGMHEKQASAKAAKSKAPSTQRKHTVASGETFYKISKKYGVSVNQLIAANPNVNHRALRIGQQINVSTTAGQAAAQQPVKKPTASLDTTLSVPVSNKPATSVPAPRSPDQPVKISKEITYGQFAANHYTTTTRLDELNGLQLDSSTVLATGSELYVPAQP
ncbi:MAG: LysM peptidoglycan-binding domain-containing protein [Luteolibacter sp.]